MDLEGEPLVMFCGVVSSICNAAAVDVENSGTGENALTNDEGSTITTVPAARVSDGSTGTSNCGPAINFSIIACFTLQISTGDSPAPRLARSAGGLTTDLGGGMIIPMLGVSMVVRLVV